MNKPSEVKVFQDVFSTRQEDTGWHVIQAMTLLKMAHEKNHLRSFVVYAAFEMRQAIEQQMFTIIRLVTKERDKSTLLNRCRKKDGLFRELSLAEHNYTNLCYLMTIIAEEFSSLPAVGNWDIKQLKQLWLKLSAYCHSPQTLDVQLDDKWYSDAVKAVMEAHNYMFVIMSASKGTGYLDLTTAKPAAKKVCMDFLSGKIARPELRAAMRSLKKQLSSG